MLLKDRSCYSQKKMYITFQFQSGTKGTPLRLVQESKI